MDFTFVQTIPDPEFIETPAPTPGLGKLGFSFFGEAVNGPLEGGFREGQVAAPPASPHPFSLP